MSKYVRKYHLNKHFKTMGCCTSAKGLDKEEIHSPIVLELTRKSCRYHGTTERGRLQVIYIYIFHVDRDLIMN